MAVCVVAGTCALLTSPAAAATAPAAPRSPVAAPRNGAASLSWLAPLHAGSARVTSYVVTPYQGGRAGQARVFASSATSQVVTGLTNGQAYAFRVAARSAAGTGPQSVPTPAVVVGAPGRPAAVSGSPGDGAATVSWRAPASNNGSAITGYVVTAYVRYFTAATVRVAGTARSAVVQGLTNGVSYRFQVSARNAHGPGPAAALSTVIVPASGSQPPPGSPPPAGNAPPPAGGYFSTLAPGSALPSEAECAARVHRSTWEPRAANAPANQTVPPQPVSLASTFDYTDTWKTGYQPRITGNFTGTTDEIIQWAACKWGWSDDVVRAQAVVESDWWQSTEGDFESRSLGHCPFDDTRDPCPTSFGLMQVRWYFHPSVSSSSSPQSSYLPSKQSTAFNVDLELAEMRGCYDGMSTYLGNTSGDLWGCIGVWYSGAWHTSSGDGYAARVQSALASRPWLSWPDQG